MDEELIAEVKKLLCTNSINETANRGGITKKITYTAPSPGIYSQQWFWDSCLHSLVWSELGEKERALQELESLVFGKGDKPFFPHMIFWKRIRNIYWWLFDGLYPTEDYSELIQPPLIGFSLKELQEKGINIDQIKEISEEVLIYYKYILKVRDPEGSNLITIIHPWESGLDSSPKFDLNISNSRFMRIKQWLRMRTLLKEFQNVNWNQENMVRQSSFKVKCVLTNTLFAWGLESFASALDALQMNEEALFMREKSKRILQSLVDHSWNEKDGLFYDLNIKKQGYEQIHVKTITSLMPLLLNIPKDIKQNLISHLTNPKEFWPKYPVPTVSMEEKTFNPKDTPLLWRGPTWINTNFFLWTGLKRHNETKIAEELTEKTLNLVRKSGFREFYNPITGDGGGAKNFGWSTLILLMQK
ncbi:MAG: MGH1-like glycoside hydrolase domain-containing protein [Candidatus Heimdallarchaeaceae archaeon]